MEKYNLVPADTYVVVNKTILHNEDRKIITSLYLPMNGTDAVMLSGETTVGKFPVEVVRFMANICENTEKYYDYEYKFDEAYVQDITTAIAHNVVESANILDVKAIVAATVSGATARMISNLKPQSIVLAACPDEKVAGSLALCYGVYPTILPIYDTTDEVINNAVEVAKEALNGGVKKTTTKAVKEVKETKKEETTDLSKLTVAELREMAKAKGIEGVSTMKKADLVAALQ